MDRELEARLTNLPDDVAKADLMTKLAAEMSDSRPGEAADLCRRALDIAERLGYPSGRADSLGILSFCEIVLARHQEALEHARTSLELLRELGEEGKACRMENQIACIHRHLGDYRMAAESYKRVMQAARESGDKLLEASALNNLGIVHHHLNDDGNALEFYHQGLALYKEAGEPRFCAVGMVNIADILREKNEHQEALVKALGAAKIFSEYGDKSGAASAHHVAGNTYRDMGDPVQAMDEWEKCIKMAREIGDLETEVEALASTALLIVSDRRAEEAIEVLDMARTQARNIIDRRIVMTIYLAYAEAWSQLGDKVKSEEYTDLLRRTEQELMSQNLDER